MLWNGPPSNRGQTEKLDCLVLITMLVASGAMLLASLKDWLVLFHGKTCLITTVIDTAACLQILAVGSTIRNLSFDATGSSLHTDIEIVALCDLPTPTPTTPTEFLATPLQSLSTPQQSKIPQYQDYGINSNGVWMTRNLQNWLWLSPMYRPTCSAVGQSELALVLGCQSGRVLVFGFVAEDCK